jgi:hypothetical protein
MAIARVLIRFSLRCVDWINACSEAMISGFWSLPALSDAIKRGNRSLPQSFDGSVQRYVDWVTPYLTGS